MNAYYVAGIPFSDELYHHGIKGQKWGVRRYQNLDGTLTAEGIARYGTVENFEAQRASTKIKNAASTIGGGVSRIASNGVQRAKDAYAKREPERERIRTEAFEASRERGRKNYQNGYSHAKNLISTSGKIAVKSLAYGVGTGVALSLGMKKTAIMLGAAGTISTFSTARDSFEKARDYERYRKIRT